MQGAGLASRPCSWAAAVPAPLPPSARPAAVLGVRGAPCAARLPALRRHAEVLQASSPASHNSWRTQRQQPGRRHLARRAAGPSSSSTGGSEAAPLALSSGEELAPSLGSPSAAPSLAPSLSSSSGSSGSYDPAGGSEGEGEGAVRIDLQLPRRSLLVQFSCNLCGGRSERLVNPVAWHKGMVIAQCQHCQAWHKLADAANLVEEIRYADLEDE